jgi:hypothetical protein
MKFRTGLLIGAAVGYYYGTKAGTSRYQQIERVLDKVRGSSAYSSANAKLTDAVDQVRELVLGRLDDALERQDQPTSVIVGSRPVDADDDTEPFELLTNPQLN